MTNPKHRKLGKSVVSESREQDYRKRLSPEDRAWLNQFMLEYYKGDFNFATCILPEKYKKDSYARNNEFLRSFENVPWDKVEHHMYKKVKTSATAATRSSPLTLWDYAAEKDPAQTETEEKEHHEQD